VTKPPSRPPRHLHVFGLSLSLIVLALVGFLFGVRMEATAPAAGVVVPGQLVRLRAPKDGTVRLGHRPLESRSTPGEPPAPGSFVFAGDEVARLGEGAGTSVLAPADSPKWLVVELPVADGQRVREGDVIAVLVAVDPETDAVRESLVRVEIDEKHAGAVAPGQEVRLFSPMYPHRMHGVAKGTLERIEPMAVEGPDGSRRFRGWVRVTESPFPLKLGSSVRAEIVTGRKRTYQIILEH
jgi:hypothetical protein